MSGLSADSGWPGLTCCRNGSLCCPVTGRKVSDTQFEPTRSITPSSSNGGRMPLRSSRSAFTRPAISSSTPYPQSRGAGSREKQSWITVKTDQQPDSVDPVSDTTDGRSLQLRIADAIRARIESGEYPPGSKLPGLPTLARTYKASLVTVRMALARLRQEGLVISRQGVGNFVREHPPARTTRGGRVTGRMALARLRQEGLVISRQGVGNFVREHPPVRRFGIGRYSRSVWGGADPQPLLAAEGARQGRTIEQATETGQVPAPAFVAERLPGITEGDLVHVRQRTTSIDGVINQSADSYFTLATGERNPDLVAGRGAGGHIARINAISPVLEIQEEITARMPTSPEASRLKIPEGTPVFEVIRTYHTAEGPLDVARFVIRADMAVFDYRFHVPD